MTKDEFFKEFRSPLPNAILKKYPNGNIRQFWAESPSLYSGYFGRTDEIGKFLCGHSGIDLATFEDDEVIAVHDGWVHKIIRNSPIGGNVVQLKSPTFLDKNGSYFCITSYGHLGSIDVTENQFVIAGERIGTEGNTGFVVSGNISFWGNAPAGKGVHLHFGYTEFNSDGSYRYPNCLGNTSDPLPIIMYKNPDYSGTIILLTNMISLLRFWKIKYNL